MSKAKSLASINDKLLSGSQLVEDELGRRLACEKPISVLEIECGEGRALMELAWTFRKKDVHFHGHNSTPGDPLEKSSDLHKTASRYSIGNASEQCSTRLPEVHFGNPTRLDLADDSIDLIYVPSIVRYVPHKAELLEEVARVLSPGGVAFIRISGAGWDHPHCLALPSPQLTQNPCRFVLLHADQLVPLDSLLSLTGDSGLDCELINLPACVIRMTKRKPGPISFGLRFDEELTQSLRSLEFDDVNGRVKQGGYRSVYHVSDEAFLKLVERGALGAETLQPAGATRSRSSECVVDAAEERQRLERNRRILASFEIGARVKVRGRRDECGVFHADKIRLNEDEEDREALEGPLERLDAEGGVLDILGFSVILGHIKRVKTFEGGKYARDELQPGMFMKVKGKSVDGRFVAEKVKVVRGSPSASQEIQTFIQAIDLAGDRFTAGEMMVQIDSSTKMEELDGSA